MNSKVTGAMRPLDVLFAALVCCLNCAMARAATPPPTLGANTLLGEENQVGANPAVTAPITTQVSGSSFLSFSAGYASNNLAPTDNKSNTWTQLGAPAVYGGEAYHGVFDARAYLVLSGTGGSNHILSIDKNGEPAGELTLPFIEIRNADVLHDVVQNYPTAGVPSPGGGTLVTSGDVTTSGPALLVALWWGDGDGLTHTAVANNGFDPVKSFLILPPLSAVQCAIAAKQVSGAGTYHVTWTQTPDQGAPLWLFAFQSSETIFVTGFD